MKTDVLFLPTGNSLASPCCLKCVVTNICSMVSDDINGPPVNGLGNQAPEHNVGE